MTEYGRIHTDGSRSGGQPVQSDAERVARALAQADGIEICSDATYALSSYGHKAQAALAAMRQPTQSDALREALEDLLHAVCGENGFAQAVRWDSGRIYPWPALDLAEAKAIAALEQNK